ncbi:hypothetical protein ACFQ4C_28700 [Larkinella insperata]|uniref:Sigma-70 family RNA polymerase sigma factor n=1 Tax=Larkinella insperata TaxID=332158 RepID=A0ABW3QF36_9BACT
MLTTNEQLPYRVTEEDQMVLRAIDYQAVALRFCESLIKDKMVAERLVSDVFREIEENGLALQPERKFKAYLFQHLRDQCLNHLRTADRAELIRQACAEPAHPRKEPKAFDWQYFIKETLQTASAVRLF